MTIEPPIDCLMCDEPLDSDIGQLIYTPDGPRRTHRVCMLREVMGGIGHLIAHDYWCLQHHDPDAGLTYYQSAKLVDAFVRVVGIDRAADRGHNRKEQTNDPQP